MLPVVTIGLDATAREAFDAWSDPATPVLHFTTAEEASYALADEQLVTARMPLVAQDDDGKWECSVVYGGEALGPAVAGRPETLAHVGWTVVAGWNVQDRQAEPRRMVDGRPQGEHPGTMVWQAAHVLKANLVVDAADQGAMRVVRDRVGRHARP